MESETEFNEWLEKAHKEDSEGIGSSAICSSIVSKGYLENPRCALQIGLAILMDKPLFLIVDKDQKIPASLVRAAQAIERVDTKNPADMRGVPRKHWRSSQRI